jgi:hypothetical protein
MTENYSFSKKQLLKFSSLESTKSSKHKQEATETIPFEILQLLNSDPVPSVPPSSVSQNTSAPGLQEEVEQIGNYFVYEKPIGEGSHSKTFLAFADKNLQEFQGVLKLAKGGHEAQLFKEIECANYFFKKNLSHPPSDYFFRFWSNDFRNSLYSSRIFIRFSAKNTNCGRSFVYYR